MLITVNSFEELDFQALMELYAEGNLENGEYFYPDRTPGEQLALAQRDFARYLQENFFQIPTARYWIYEENGVYLSALRLEPHDDGLLLEALETHPAYRRMGFAKQLIREVLGRLPRGTRIYSEVARWNTSSLAAHRSCGFTVVSEHSGSENYLTFTITT